MVLPGRESPAATVAALERQSRPPERVLVAGGEPDPLRAALETRADWLWLLEGGVRPEVDALQAFLDALERLGSLTPPVLLAGWVMTPAGTPDPSALPVPEVRNPDLVVAAVERRLLAIRVAPGGSLLVRRAAVEANGLPSSGGDLVWSARLLKREPGMLVPASVAVASGAGGHAGLARWLRLAASGALELRERPWFAFHLIEEALGAARRAGRGGSPPRPRASGA